MRAWLLALAACGAAPTVIGNRAPVGASHAAAPTSRVAVAPYAGCDETGCPLQLREALLVTLPVDPQLAVLPPLALPPDRAAPDFERDVAARHRKLLVENLFEY